MKRIIFIFCLLSVFTIINASVYLVQPGGASGAIWNGVSGTVVDLALQGKSLNDWYKSMSYNVGDEIWLIKGTYVLTDSLVTQTTEKIYGGFAGTEQSISSRQKGPNSWDFTNETILDGNNSVRGIVSLTSATIDGISIQNCTYSSTTAGNCASAVKLSNSSILQNSIVRNNTITGLTTGFYSGGVYITNGGKLQTSYVHHNNCANTLGGGNGGGATIYQIGTIDGCTISDNTAYRAGGGVNIIARTGGAVVNNSIILNNTATNGVAGGVNLTGGTNIDFASGKNVTISNCTISSNSAKTDGGGLYMEVPGTNPSGWNSNQVAVTNCTITSNLSLGNGGGLYLSNGQYTISGCTINNNESRNSTANEANGGGGIFTKNSPGSNLTLNNSIISGNIAKIGTKGSAIRTDMSWIKVNNCLIKGNVGDNFQQQGTGRQCYYQNCTVACNTTAAGAEAGMYLGWTVTAISTFTNCLFYKSSTNPIGGYWTDATKYPVVTYCGFEFSTFPANYSNKTGCITGLTSAAFADAVNGDWTLGASSPAIDAGTTIATITNDLTGTNRPQGTAYDMGAYESPAKITSNTNASSLTLNANSTLSISNGSELTINGNATVKSIVVNPGGKLTINSGCALNTNTLSLMSNSSGTATLVDKNIENPQEILATVQQYLPQGRNWYVTSPIATGTINQLNTGTSVVSYNEQYARWDTETGTLTPGRGYISVSNSGSGTNNVSFSGSLNTGTISVNLTRLGIVKSGFNLIGNPYPSYLDWSLVDTTAAKITPTVWYRTKTASNSYTFDTYNGKANVGTSNGENAVTNLIPPMQSFWVRVKPGEEAGTITFTNAMRKHIDVTNNKLKAPSTRTANQEVLRLRVSNGTNSDEALVLFNSEASNGYDSYDSPKMSGGVASLPEIFTTIGNENMVINGLTKTDKDKELALGFSTGENNTFSIKATEISNFATDTRIILRDNLTNSEADLTSGEVYEFNSDITNSTSRFKLYFRSPAISTGVNKSNTDNFKINLYRNKSNQIILESNSNDGLVCISDIMGKKLLSEKIEGNRTIINSPLTSGVYFVSLIIDGAGFTKKIIVN